MSNNFLIYLLILASVTVFGLYRFWILSKAYRVLVLLLVYTLISEVLSRFAIVTPYASYLYWTYATVKIPSLLLILGLAVNRDIRKKSLFIVSFIVLVACIVAYITLRPVEAFPSILEMLTAPVTVVAALVAYKDLLDFPTEKKLMHQPLFCLATAVLLYTSITFTHISLYRYYLKYNISPIPDGRIHTWLTWIYYAFLGYILYIAQRKNRINADAI